MSKFDTQSKIKIKLIDTLKIILENDLNTIIKLCWKHYSSEDTRASKKSFFKLPINAIKLHQPDKIIFICRTLLYSVEALRGILFLLPKK
jgi:hypothetical protein